MKNVEALKKLAVAMKGSGSEADITEERIAGVILYMAEHWDEFNTGSGTSVSVDTLSGATETGTSLMKAADAQTARNAIGAGEPYTLPAAGDAIGGVKKCAAVDFTKDSATAETCATAIDALITNMKAAGMM